MKSYLTFLFCIFLGISLHSQTVNQSIDYPIFHTQMKPGLIHTFTDFQQGKITDVPGTLFLTENSEVGQKIIGKIMKLALKDSITQNVKLVEDNIWGFCDGKDIYIRDDVQYCKLTIGKFCYYKKMRLYFIYSIPVTSEELLFFTIQYGRNSRVPSLLKILKQYPDLREEYRKDTDYKDKDIRYLQKLNAL